MVFKRRNRLPVWRRMREWILPKTGWTRAVTYMGHRLKRLPDSPTRIARGVGIGVFFSFTPFFGFHILLAMLFAKVFRSNVIAAVVGTFFGNPLTFPFIIAASYGLGRYLVGHSGRLREAGGVQHAFSDAFRGVWNTLKSLFGYGYSEVDGLLTFWHDVFFPYLIGGIIPGLVAGIVSFYLTRPVVHTYQIRRRKKLIEKWRTKSGEDSGG